MFIVYKPDFSHVIFPWNSFIYGAKKKKNELNLSKYGQEIHLLKFNSAFPFWRI